MTNKEFFERLRNQFNNGNDYLIELLRLRGFVIEERADGLHLNDNPHKDDSACLRKLFTEYHCGELIGSRIIIDAGADVLSLEGMFADEPPIEGIYERTGSGNGFRHRVHGEDVPVALLDPFIARYIKAISACSVRVKASCDGNHPRMDRLVIMIEDRVSRLWHQMIYEKCLAGMCSVSWNRDYTAAELRPDNKYNTYYDLNKAAAWLYGHRQEIRGILNRTLREIAGCFRDHSEGEIERSFVVKADSLFDESMPLLR